MLTGTNNERHAKRLTHKGSAVAKHSWRGHPSKHAHKLSMLTGLGDTGITAIDQAIGAASFNLDTLRTALTLTAVASVVSALATIGLILRSRKG